MLVPIAVVRGGAGTADVVGVGNPMRPARRPAHRAGVRPPGLPRPGRE